MTAFDLARVAAGYAAVALIVWTTQILVGF